MSQATARYLKWVKDSHPQVFAIAVKKVRMRTALGGLGDDLTSDLSFDPGTVAVDPSASAAVDQAANSSSVSDAWGSFFSSLSDAVSNIAPQIVKSKQELTQIQVNQQRASRGLGPLGQAPNFSAAWLIGGAAVVGVLMMAKGHRR